MQRRNPSGAAALLTLAVVLATATACNSTARVATRTVDRPATVAGGPASSGGSSAVTESGAGATSSDEASGVTGGATGASTAAAAGSATGGSSDASAPAGGTSGGGGVGVGQGVTDKTIKIGIEVNKPIDYGAFGGKGTSTDQVPPTKAVVDYLNAHGGIGGRQIVPVFHEIDVTSGSFAEQAQTACTDLAEDKKVFLAISITDGSPQPACYAQHDVPYLDQRRFLADRTDVARFPSHFYMVGRLVAGERWGKAFIDGIADQRFFDGAVKLGIFRYDGAAWQRLMSNVIRPALAAHGVSITVEEAGPEPTSAADLSRLSGPMSNAILRFRSTGVNRVIFIETGGAAPFLFMPTAESQGFRPRYGLNSMNALYFLQSNDPPSQLHGSVAVGWYPSDDTNGVFRTNSAAEQLCIQIFRQTGQGAADLPETLGYCDTLFLVKRALEGAPSFTVAGFRAGLERLGTAYQPASTFASRFGPDRHEEADAARGMVFDDGCACFRYVGATFPMP